MDIAEPIKPLGAVDMEPLRERILDQEAKRLVEREGSDQYKKYNCLILIDNPSVHYLFPALKHAFYYQK